MDQWAEVSGEKWEPPEEWGPYTSGRWGYEHRVSVNYRIPDRHIPFRAELLSARCGPRSYGVAAGAGGSWDGSIVRWRVGPEKEWFAIVRYRDSNGALTVDVMPNDALASDSG